MKIDRMLFFDRFVDQVRKNNTIQRAVEAGNWEHVIDYVNREVFDKPEEYYSLDKLRRAAAVDRRLSLREILEKVFDLIPEFKSKDEMLEEEFSKFVAGHVPPSPQSVPAIKNYFKAYTSNPRVRHLVDEGRFGELAANSAFSIQDYRAVPAEYRVLVPEYIKDYVPLNQFAA